MTVDATLAGKALTPAGRQIWALDATVVEDATALSLDDTFGGVGSIDLRTETLDNTMLLSGAAVSLAFSDGGVRDGIVSSISDNAGVSSISGATNMMRLNREVNAKPVTTTIGDALRQYFGLCGLGVAQYSIDASIAARPAVLPGWDGNCWERLKEMATIEWFDIGDVSGVVTVAPRGQNTLNVGDAHDTTLALSENITGRSVETHFYTYTPITNAPIYPSGSYDEDSGTTTKGGWTRDAQVLTVTPGAPTVVEEQVMASLSAVQQPVCIKTMGPDYAGVSTYTVVTNDGVETVDPAVWTRLGGKITVEILPDTRTLRITVDAGDNLAAAAPYRICISSGNGTDYPTLRINGTGMAIEKNRLRMRTSVPEWATDTDIASSTDSIFCRTQEQARRVLRGQASAASMSLSNFSAAVSEVPLSFGKRAGAIISRPEANYRVATCSTGSNGSQVQADRYTTIAAFNAAWAGKKVADFNAAWAGYKVRNFNTSPLLTQMPEPPAIPVLTGYGYDRYSEGTYG